MNDNLTTFKTWCRDAFTYLLTDYGFRELDEIHPKHANPFQARFANATTEIIVLGEGYGAIATVYYITEDGTEVAMQMLEPGWEPFKKRKRKKMPQASQRDEVYAAANRIRERDRDILAGESDRLRAAAARWMSICAKMGWK